MYKLPAAIAAPTTVYAFDDERMGKNVTCKTVSGAPEKPRVGSIPTHPRQLRVRIG